MCVCCSCSWVWRATLASLISQCDMIRFMPFSMLIWLPCYQIISCFICKKGLNEHKTWVNKWTTGTGWSRTKNSQQPETGLIWVDKRRKACWKTNMIVYLNASHWEIRHLFTRRHKDVIRLSLWSTCLEWFWWFRLNLKTDYSWFSFFECIESSSKK